MIKVMIQLDKTTQPIVYENALNVYEKGSFLCVALEDKTSNWYPIDHIFRVVQDFGFSVTTYNE